MPYKDIEKRKEYERKKYQRNREKILSHQKALRNGTETISRPGRALQLPVIFDVSIRDLEWTAGFLEGEGHFRGGSGIGNSAEVKATNCQLAPLLKLQELYGGSIGKNDKIRSPNHSQGYRWHVCGGKARGLMLVMHGLMMSEYKRNQIERVLGS